MVTFHLYLVPKAFELHPDFVCGQIDSKLLLLKLFQRLSDLWVASKEMSAIRDIEITLQGNQHMYKNTKQFRERLGKALSHLLQQG